MEPCQEGEPFGCNRKDSERMSLVEAEAALRERHRTAAMKERFETEAMGT